MMAILPRDHSHRVKCHNLVQLDLRCLRQVPRGHRLNRTSPLGNLKMLEDKQELKMISDRTVLKETPGNSPTPKDNRTSEQEATNPMGQIEIPMGEEEDHPAEEIHREEAEDHLEDTIHQVEEEEIPQEEEETIPLEEVEEDTVLMAEVETDQVQVTTRRVTTPSKATREIDPCSKGQWVKGLLAITHIAILREM